MLLMISITIFKLSTTKIRLFSSQETNFYVFPYLCPINPNIMENEIQTKVQTENHHEAKTAHCLNCGKDFEGNFCPECGQSAETGRFTLRFIFGNLLAAVLGRDGGVAYTLKNLFSRPGKMIVEILNGKRRKYVSPFPMLFLALTVYILIFTLTGSKGVISSDLDLDFTNNTQENVQIALEIDRLVVKAFHFYLNHYTLCYMLTLPLFVIAARICFGIQNRKRYYLAEYTVGMVYALVILVLYRCVINLIYPISTSIYETMALLEPIAIITALTACFRRMMGFSTVKTIWRSTLTTALYYSMLGVIALIVIFVIAYGLVLKYTK